MIEVILILSGIIVVLIVSISLLNKSKNHKIKNLEDEKEKLEQNIRLKSIAIKSMRDHSDRIKYTKEELEPIKKKVREAESEEDVMDTIGLLVDINNRKL